MYSLSTPSQPAAAEHVVTVRELDSSRRADWDAFVDACPEATFFHRAGWQEVIEKAFGHATRYLFAEENGRIVGVLPLAHVKSRLFGDALISMPFGVYGGVAASHAAAKQALLDRARAIAEQVATGYLELRCLGGPQTDWPTKDLYVTFRKAIDPDPEVNLKAIPRKQRAMVRKGQTAGLESREDADLAAFYGMYSESVRNLGTPVFSRRYFQLLHQVFGPSCRLLTITHAGQPVASVMSFYFRDQVLPFYGGGSSLARDTAANDFMYWELLRRSALDGIRLFDYGRSKIDSGSYRFKKHWGFEPEPLHYQYFLVKSRDLPNLSPTNPKYQLMIRAWRRLPLPVANAIGPWISRSLG